MVRNVFSNWIGFIARGIISFALTPLLIRHLGDFQFGIWVLVMSVIDYSGILDLGIRPTLHRYVARLSGANARRHLNEIMASALAISCLTGGLVILFTFACLPIVPRIFGIIGPAAITFRWVILLLGVNLAILFPAGVLGAYLCGVQRFDLFNVLSVASTAVRALLIVIILEFGHGVVGVAVVTLVTSVLALVLHYAVVRRADPGVSLSLSQASWLRVRELGSFSFYVLLNSGGDYLRFYTDSIVIARFLTIALITPFNVAGRLMDYFRTIISGLAGPLVPKMSELLGRGKLDAVVSLFLKGTRAAALLSGFIGAMVFLNGRALLHFWVGQRFESSYYLLLILTVGYVFTLAQLPSNVALYAFARHQLLGWWTLVEGALNLTLSIYWGRKFGLIGVALGTTVPMLVTAFIFLPWNVLPLLRLRPQAYLRVAIGRPFLVSASFIAICYLVLGGKQPDNIWIFVGNLTWQTTLFAILGYTFGISTSDRGEMTQRFQEFTRPGFRWLARAEGPAEIRVEPAARKWGNP